MPNVLTHLRAKALRVFLVAVFTLGASGCATHAQNPADPFEPFNRGVYQFNDTMDKVAIKPAASAYNMVMPDAGKTAVSNFFSNLNDFLTTINDLLQGKFAQAASDGSRFLFNSTFGVLGIFDVAHRLEKHNEDFGQTLGYWGMGSGPYLVLPFFGPSTLRDTVGLYADSQMSILNDIDDVSRRNLLYVAKIIDTRSNLLDKEKLLDEAALDRYAFIRDSFLQHRQNQVYDGEPPRNKLEEDDVPAEGGEQKNEPIPKSQAPIPGYRLAKHDDIEAVFAQTNQMAEVDAQDSVHEVWLSQRTGIR